jgi:hypothetical protein
MLEKLAAKSDNNKIAIAEEGAIPIMMKVCVRHHRVDICITALACSLYYRTHMLSVSPHSHSLCITALTCSLYYRSSPS